MKQTPKILVISEVFFPEDFLINNLVKEWIEKGYPLEVLARIPSYPFGKTFNGYKNKLFSSSEYHGIKVNRVAFIKGYKKSVFLKILNYLLYVILTTSIIIIKGRKFDRFFIFQTGPLSLAIPGVIAKILYRKKVIIWTQDLWPDTVYAYGFRYNRLNHWILNRFVKFIYTNCDTIFISCPGFKNKLEFYLGEKRNNIYTAPNWPIIGQGNTMVEKMDLGQGFHFTFTGNIGKVQNLDNVILGFAQFNKNFPTAQLNLVGDGSNVEELKKLIFDLNIPNVIFWGKHPVTQMPSFYSASHVLLLSLKDEPIYEITIPLKFQTYLTTGKPIFGVIKGDTKNLIEKNNIGFTALPSNIHSIAQGFERFISFSENERMQMGINAFKLLKNDFNQGKIIEKITDQVFH